MLYKMVFTHDYLIQQPKGLVVNIDHKKNPDVMLRKIAVPNLIIISLVLGMLPFTFVTALIIASGIDSKSSSPWSRS